MSPEGERLRVVADTNVLFSTLAFPADSPPAKVLRLILDDRVHAFTSPFIVDELERALRERAGWDTERLSILRRRLKPVLTVIAPTVRLHVIRRIEADNRILECAAEANVDVLITGNMRDLHPLGSFRGIEILTPREFLDKYFQS